MTDIQTALVAKWRHIAEDFLAAPASIGSATAAGWLGKCAGELEAALAVAPAPEGRRQDSCRKVTHNARQGGYLHAADDDGPYDVDGVAYCGRCHGLHPLPRGPASSGGA